MKKYVVVSAKPVTVRVGTQAKSENKILTRGDQFEASEAFAADLLAISAIRAVEDKKNVAQAQATTARPGKKKTEKEK